VTAVTSAVVAGWLGSPHDQMDRLPAVPAIRGTAMTINSRITSLAACVAVAGFITWAYAGVCLAYAVDCF
jgi:hypothetical protein